MKRIIVSISLVALVASCNIQKEESGEMPEVDIETEGGELPEYDVNWADVDVGTNTRTVEVPKVIVVMEEEEVEVPYITMDIPDEEETERSLVVEAEVSDKEHDIEIQEIRASDRRLYVISELEELDTDLGDQTVRVQDQVDINAPDLDVKHIIIGKKADRVFNNSYTYVDSRNDFSEEVKEAQVIYTR